MKDFNFSPATKAVFDAYLEAPSYGPHDVAAVLRAVVEQTIPQVDRAHRGTVSYAIAADILAIAAELEAAQ